MHQPVVRIHSDHRGQGHRERFHLTLSCGHIITRTRRTPVSIATEIHCPQCTHIEKTGQETRL